MVYFGLFLVFAASLAATKHLDAYSSQYVSCAQKWKSLASDASDNPALAARVMEMMDNAELTAGGKPCPALRKDHDLTLRTDLENVSRLSLR